MEKTNSYDRYHRQMILPGFGESTQQRLSRARVLVIGAGGLGCPALQYLAAAGVGTIGIADGDTVALSNLHRQVLYSTNDIGKNKALCAAAVLQVLNPEIEIITFPEHVTVGNLLDMLDGFDIVVDGTDNFATRYMINDACVLKGKTLVYGAVSQYEGQVAVFNYLLPDGSRSSNYRHLFPYPPKDGEVLNCAEAGVLGVMPGVIGTMQANEVIKLLTISGRPLIDLLSIYNGLINQLYTLDIRSEVETESLMPADENQFRQTDYVWLCSSPAIQHEIDQATFNQFIQQPQIDIVDVRELHEQPSIDEFQYHRIPLAVVKERSTELKNDTVVVFCQSGKRSLAAVELLATIFGDTKKIYSLKGGILSWKESQQTK